MPSGDSAIEKGSRPARTEPTILRWNDSVGPQAGAVAKFEVLGAPPTTGTTTGLLMLWMGIDPQGQVPGPGYLGFGGPLSPKFSYWYDNDKVKGGYGSFGISHSFALGSKASLDFSGSVGWDFGYNNKAVGDGTLNDALFGVNVPIQIRENLSIHGSVQRSIALDSLDKRREADPSLTGTSEDETIVTFGASISF